MSIEREIKLALPPEQADAAARYLAKRAGDAGREIPLDN
ncbi:MAG TPA: CYTH domain-containing protein, partial [Trinickia sp.]|nr:CYTH domain-containing protein [Trinickia sp.]